MEQETRRIERRQIWHDFRTQILILGGFVAFMWGLEIIDTILTFISGYQEPLNQFGVRPRTLVGLRNIFFAPFLHVGFAHLIANTVPFVVLGWLIMARKFRDFVWVTLIVSVIGGFGIWLIADTNSTHLGASILIFGYFGFLFLRGFFERSLPSIGMTLIVTFLYGGIMWGVLPQATGISWQGHLFGFIGGGLAAYLLSERPSLPRDTDSIEINILE